MSADAAPYWADIAADWAGAIVGVLSPSGNDLLSTAIAETFIADMPSVGSSTNAGSIIIAGATNYDNSPAALDAIMQVWTSSAPYSQRVDNLRSGVASSGYKLDATTIKPSAAVDQVFATVGDKWFWDLSGKSLLIGLRPGVYFN